MIIVKTNEKIKKRRLELNLTLVDIATHLGVTEATAQRYESGYIKNIKADTMAKLAEVLKTTPAYLMGWENGAAPDSANEADMPEEFVVMARKSGRVSATDREKLYKVLDATIDAFLANYNHEGE